MTERTRTPREASLSGRLTRLGFCDVPRAERLLADKAITAVLGEVDAAAAWLDHWAMSADPDLGLLTLVRLCERAAEQAPGSALATSIEALATGGASSGGQAEGAALSGTSAPGTPDSDWAADAAVATARFFGVIGASTALGDDIVRRPDTLLAVIADQASAVGVDARAVRAELLESIGADPAAAEPVATVSGGGGVDAMRRAYRTRLLRIAATDVTATDPLTLLPGVAAALADLAAAALEAALAWARAEHADHGVVRLAVMGMGKTGGRELNYVSDVDVIYVAEPAAGCVEDEALAVGARLVASLQHACSAPSGEPPLWPVDAALRPEGKQGPIVRTLASHRAYYERWAKTWEFQALLKARPVAGDRELGAAYFDTLNPLVWQAVGRENFVADSQAMRRRVEDHVPPAERDRQIKLGQGGLRDVEFTVQLLQLVHGRADAALHSGNTLTALAALSHGGYVSRADAAKLAVCYRFLRLLEHRIQLYRMHRTHLMPKADVDLRRLARAVGMRAEGVAGLMERWKATRRQVRSLHEDLFYRPLLPATAQLSADDVSLAPEAAATRLEAIGYRDPAGAMRHIRALTEGVSRRALIQRHLLPVMLGWFAQGADPDRGLLAFRRLSDDLGESHWYLKLLRDSGTAAQRLTRLLSNSQLAVDMVPRTPEVVTWLADDAELTPLGKDRLRAELSALLGRAQEEQAAALSVRAIRRRELARLAAGELLGVTAATAVQEAISDVTDLTLEGGLRIAEHCVLNEEPAAVIADDAARAGGDQARETGAAAALAAVDAASAAPARIVVVAMGRLGGREMTYGSDADVMYVYEARDGADAGQARDYALAVASRIPRELSSTAAEPALAIDVSLRPEGRNGPLIRSFDSYREYYARWSLGWESQALLRARVAAGPADLAERFVSLIDPLRYPSGGLTVGDVREIRRIKARVESERLPRGLEPHRHLKLGPGGISDVEWLTQLLQLQHGHRVAGLRTTQTLPALAAAREAELLSSGDEQVLREAWTFACRVRAAVVLWSGKTTGAAVDALPHSYRDLAGVAAAMRFDGGGHALEDAYLRSARRAREVFQRLFYGG